MKVLLVVIDAASPRVVCPAIQTGRLRNLQRVADAGGMHQGSVTIFPSITPAATSSIITGAYPVEHGIAGASWYDEAQNEVAYYGDDFWVIAKKGFGAFLRDFLVRLNGDRLKAPTLFELVERRGRRAACVNYLVYRGIVPHKVNVPWLLSFLPGVPFTETVNGPTVLCLGDFVTPRTRHGKVEDRGGLLHRFGMDDASSAQMLCELVAEGATGDLTVAYFADNDFRSHEVGPVRALPVVERVDRALGEVFDAAGGFERFVRGTCVIVTSDHGHCEILPDADRAVIRLDRVLSDLRQADLRRAWRDRDEIMICPNMRAAQIYLRQPAGVIVDRVSRAALADARVDLVLWRTQPATRSADTYNVESQRGRLEFWRGEDGPAHARDAFGTGWSWRGDRAVLQLEVDGGVVESTEYPNAFERVACALDAPASGELWLTARPGCEFEVPGGKAHVGGGSHGALHALDSLSPVVVGGAGAPKLPRAMRSVDIAPLCMELVGLPMRYRVGDPRGAVPVPQRV
ncbi:MAG: alkaline phosphatase family protein [Vicinamibacterales bacterium]